MTTKGYPLISDEGSRKKRTKGWNVATFALKTKKSGITVIKRNRNGAGRRSTQNGEQLHSNKIAVCQEGQNLLLKGGTNAVKRKRVKQRPLEKWTNSQV